MSGWMLSMIVPLTLVLLVIDRSFQSFRRLIDGVVMMVSSSMRYCSSFDIFYI